MRAICVLSLAAALLGGCAHIGPAVTAFNEGDLSAPMRVDTVECLRQLARPTDVQDVGASCAADSHYVAVRVQADELQRHYSQRARRQQIFMDTSAGLTAFGAAGALEGGLTASTREAWAIAAFVPVVVDEFNAYEPTRELYHGGALALQLISRRYDRLFRALELMENSEVAFNCTTLGQTVGRIHAWPARNEQRADDPGDVILAEADRILADCQRLEQRAGALTYLVDHMGTLRDQLARDYAADVLRLDHALLAKDRELRYTAGETLSAIAASPFRAIDGLLTGEDSRNAINSIRTQITFSGLNLDLATMPLPQPPASPGAPAVLSSAVAARSLSSSTPANVATEVRALRAQLEVLRGQEQRLAFLYGIAGDLLSASRADHLRFSYDPATRTTTVRLEPRPTPPTGTMSLDSAATPVS
ncbi:MAG: hypothetical protein ACI8U3_002416 [Brevundimonas sp.]|jgi:hypothetical protein|uniref:hypothetical protein n=1 Tax=Brevundimonas sp. TaxID=1871086 RepID=UPI0039E4C128